MNPTEPPRIPTTGMRGGLGRTLLTAFLVLAIVPLSTISWYATQRERRDIQREVTAKLSSAAAMMEMHIRQWVEHRLSALALLAALPATQDSVRALITGTPPIGGAEAGIFAPSPSQGEGWGEGGAEGELRAQLHTLLAQDPAFHWLAALDNQGRVLASTRVNLTLAVTQASALYCTTLDPTDDSGWVIVQPITDPAGLHLGLLAASLNPGDLLRTMQPLSGLGQTGEIYLVDTRSIALPHGRALTSPGIQAALSGENHNGLDENYAGLPVIGVYRWIPELNLALVAEQAQDEAFATTDTVTAALVGATLAAALATAVIAAFVTQHITRPIVRLTESALRIADGQMDQRVPVTSRDEIGILAYVFNRMATELKALYDDLEQKVAQRTALLQEANYQIQRRAIQLATTVKVSQVATSILEPQQLLREVVSLIREANSYTYVGIYLLDHDRKLALLHQSSGGNDKLAAAKARPVSVNPASPCSGGNAVGQTVTAAVLTAKPTIVRWDTQRAQELLFSSAPAYIRAEAALPLTMGHPRTPPSASPAGPPPSAPPPSAPPVGGVGGGVIGVLDILSTDAEDFDTDDVSVLQTMANQITIALENARAYAVEREAAKQLRELDRSKRRFLGHMSHELRTPLTNIIGFSRLMLKGIDGALADRQRQDLEIIYRDGQHLLGLINDLLDISQIEAGLMELEFREVNLVDLIHSVMATASALVRDKDVELRLEIAPDLPQVQADETRIREVLLRLLANAARSTPRGAITVRSWSNDQQVLVSVSDTGVGIPPEDQQRIFERGVQRMYGMQGMYSSPSSPSSAVAPPLREEGSGEGSAGLGVALSKEFVEMHGGRIWVESEVNKGSTFTFALPLRHS